MKIDFIDGFPERIYVGQTKIQLDDGLPSDCTDLAGLNLALHVQDNPQRVQSHRIQLLQHFADYGVTQLTWLNQTHSTQCHRIDGVVNFQALDGDALVSSDVGHALMIMTADCLPIVLVNADGSEIANLHAGWKGLAQGIIENTLNTMKSQAVFAWLGAGISQTCFEVGGEVREQFLQRYSEVSFAFQTSTQHGKYQADLYAVARFILQRHGVERILGGESCTYRQASDYYSYRRNSKTGRMATFVFIGTSHKK